MNIGRKAAGIALAASLPAIGLLAVPGSPVAAATPHLLPAMDPILPPSVTAHSQKVGPLSPSTPFHFGVVLPSRDPAGLAQMAQAVSTPHSPFYHHFMTHAEVMAKYGPDPALVSQIIAGFQKAGLKAVQQNQMLAVSGTVAQVNQLFRTQLTQYKQGSTSFVAPNTALALPSWLRGAGSLTGFAQGTPSTGFMEAKHLTAKWAPLSAMRPTPTGATSTASDGPFSVTVQRVTDGARAPGLAVRYLVTATLNGQPDTNFLSVVGTEGPFAGAAGLVQWYSNPAAGQILTDFTMSQQQTISMAMTISDGTYSATVQLPAAAFVGPAVKVANAANFLGQYGLSGPMIAPWNPASNNVNTAFNAQQLVNAGTQAESYGYAPRIGVYTAGGISTNGGTSGIGFGVPENDATMFAGKFNLPVEHFSTGYVGPNSIPDSGYGGIEGEMSLDLQMMESSAPGANITVYSAGSLRSALNQVAMQDQVSVFSISYGGGELVEELFSPGAQQTWDMLAQMANLEGITISVSAGDNGAYSGAQYVYYGVPASIAFAPQPSYPANSAEVSAIGGTEDAVGTHGQLNSAAMWGGNIGREIGHSTLLQFLSVQNMIASGGISTIEPTPGYQAMMNPSLTGRMTPDLSLPASVVTPGYFGFFDGAENLSGGTSAGAPLFAGWMADLANYDGLQGNVNPMLYSLYRVPSFRLPGGSIMTPVRFGNNGAYTETAQDNAVTGLGQLNVDALFQALNGRNG